MVCLKVSVASALLISFLNAVDLGASANCTVMTNCKTCLDYNETKCFWCSSTEKCIKMGGILPKGCKSIDWRYFDNCTVAGYVWVIVLPVLGFLILVALGCCFYCCCCTCQQNALRQDAEEKKFRDEKKQMRHEHAERRAQREEKAFEIRQKYGISRKDDPV